MLQSVTPVLDAKYLIDSLLGLTKDKKNTDGNPKSLQVMVWHRHYKARTYIVKVPVTAQKILAFLLAPVESWRGYKAAYKEYSGVDL